MTVYDRRDKDPTFAADLSEALEQSTDALELEARRRAVEGVDEPVYGSGGTGRGTVLVGTIRRYSDKLLLALLQAHRPEKFRHNHRHEHMGALAQVHVYLPANGRDAEPTGG